jgi:hypothetical protein
MEKGDDRMARKRKQTEPAPATLEELPRDPEGLTSEEAEAAKGGFFYSYVKLALPIGDDDIIHVFGPPEE